MNEKVDVHKCRVKGSMVSPDPETGEPLFVLVLTLHHGQDFVVGFPIADAGVILQSTGAFVRQIEAPKPSPILVPRPGLSLVN